MCLHAAVTEVTSDEISREYMQDHMPGWDFELRGMPSKMGVLKLALHRVNDPNDPRPLRD